MMTGVAGVSGADLRSAVSGGAADVLGKQPDEQLRGSVR
jgi:hypothetical protein